MVRRSQRLASHDPTPASTSATAVVPTSSGSWRVISPLTRVTVCPTATSPATRPATTTGTTARTDGPSVPVNVSTTVPPAAAGAIVPRKWPPISAGLGWL